ncbi:MAG: ArnT family glycosyltransferase, partial [Flavobacteriales bacterium]
LPLWFMAASLKVFGIHEYAVCLPGIIFALLSVWLTYLIARIIFNEPIALIACALHAIHGMHTDLASGRLSSDGVETCFLFFVQLGMYAVFRRQSGQFKWKDYVFTGIATGLAIMCKWQPALLVLVVMFVYQFRSKDVGKHMVGSVLALVIALATFAPWCCYILYAYPIEAKWMLRAIFTPFQDTTINTDGTWYSYLTDFGNLFGYSAFLLLASVAWRAMKSKSNMFLALFIWATLPLLIFSLAEVKRGTYLFISAPALFILISWAAAQGWRHIRWSERAIPILGFVSILSIAVYSFEKLYLFRDNSAKNAWSAEIKGRHYEDGEVIYNEPRSIEVMFYHNVTAYPFEKPSPK